MNRRAFLAASGIGFAAVSAGCTSLADENEREYAFGISNGSRESRSFRVRIGNDVSGAWFYEETFELDAETATEEVRIDETPAVIHVKVDSSDEREFPWPASRSEPGRAARKANVFYEPSLQQEVIVEAE